MMADEPREPYNPADEGQVRARRRKLKIDQDDHLKDVREVMQLGAGRRVLWGLLERAKVFQSTFAPDPSISAFQEGQRNLGLVLLNDVMEACPELYLKAQAEATERKETPDNG